MSGTDVFSGAAIAAADWSDDVSVTPGADGAAPLVTVLGLGSGAAAIAGSVSQQGDRVTLTVPAAGGGTFQEQVQAVCDIGGGSVFQDTGGGYWLFSDTALTEGRSYAGVAGFGHFDDPPGEPSCFAERTCIETDRGAVPVEALRPGDRVRLYRRPGFAPVIWTGRRAVICARHRAQDVWPIRIAAHAFAPGRPARDLYLSPEHAVLVDGALVPVRHLLNDATVVQVPADRVTYWHVELPEHDVLLAEGLPAESYLDTGNRADFSGTGAGRPGGRVSAADAWAHRACAPKLEDAARQAVLRALLRERAGALGYHETRDAGLRLRAAGQALRAVWDGSRIEAVLPGGLRVVHLHSRTAVPAQHLADSIDDRRLGVAVTQVRLDGHALDLADGRLLAGWHPPEPALRWTDGLASLVLPPTPRSLHLEVLTAPMLRYWQTGLPQPGIPQPGLPQPGLLQPGLAA